MAIITEDYVSFETAKLLKDKGFDIECDYLYANGEILRAQGFKCNWNKGESIFTDYKNECSAPTHQMVMKWLRIEHNIHIEILMTNHSMSERFDIPKYYWVVVGAKTSKWITESTLYSAKQFDTNEKACEAAIKHCLEKLI